MSDQWDRDAELAAVNAKAYSRPQDRIIAAMWVYANDLRVLGREFAQAKTEHERLLAKASVRFRVMGERSAEMAQARAHSEDSEVHATKLRYRVAEQAITQNREALRILHAQLEDLRTQHADARAASVFHANDRDVS